MHSFIHPVQAIVWGFAATLVLTTLLESMRGLGFTRIDVPLLVGTIFTLDRDRAKRIGFCVHMLNGWIFSFLYIAIFASVGKATWWLGACLGIVHAVFVLVVGMDALPSIHP